MLDVRIHNKSPPIIFRLGFIRFWREPQPLFFVNIPSIILRPDKYNKWSIFQSRVTHMNYFYFEDLCKNDICLLLHTWILSNTAINQSDHDFQPLAYTSFFYHPQLVLSWCCLAVLDCTLLHSIVLVSILVLMFNIFLF